MDQRRPWGNGRPTGTTKAHPPCSDARIEGTTTEHEAREVQGEAEHSAAAHGRPGRALAWPRAGHREGDRGGRGRGTRDDVRPGLRHDAGVLHVEGLPAYGRLRPQPQRAHELPAHRQHHEVQERGLGGRERSLQAQGRGLPHDHDRQVHERLHGRIRTRSLDTYLLRDVAVREIGRWGADRPLFMVVSFHGPHFPAFFDAADADRFTDLEAPRGPSWGVSDADDPQYVRDQAPLTAEEARAADTLYRKKARSLLAIRRAIVDIVKRFEEKGQLDDTYFVFTSDNGYRHGEHAMVHGKHTPYEEDINVPLFVRGPDVGRGVRLPNFALNIDLAPTFCEWAGIGPRPYMDGRLPRAASQGRVCPLAHQL